MQTIAGGLLGCLAVQLIISAQLVKSVSTCGFTVGFTAGPAVWGVGLGVIVLAGICGSFIPAFRAANLDIVTAIRRDD
jgi:ABC-type antimicrobial peptide transport system permease subunit